MKEMSADFLTARAPESLQDWLKCIQTKWELTEEKMAALTHVSVAQYANWFSGAAVNSPATVPPGMETAVPLVSIYKSLAAQYPEVDEQVKWLFTAHQDFGNLKPIDIAASTLENLSWVSYYLQTKHSKT